MKGFLPMALATMLLAPAFAAGPLTYAGWNAASGAGAPTLDVLEQRMIAAWNDAHPESAVILVEPLDPVTWEKSLAKAAGAGTAPDVFVVRNLPTAIAGGWLADITDLAFADPDWRALPIPVGNALFHDHAVIAVPFTQHFMGYFVNTDLLSEEKHPLPEPGWTVAQFEELVRSLAKPQKQVLGLTEEVQIPEWYPSAVSPHVRWFTWDGRGYNLDSAQFKAGVQMARRFFTSAWVFDGLRDESRGKFASRWPGEAWEKGTVALRWEGTWSLSSFARLGFRWEFIGVPGGRTPIVNDWLGISRRAAQRAAAYEFARWMTFSRTGSLLRLKIADAEGLAVGSLPVTSDPQVLEAYFRARGTPGIRKLYASLDRGIVEGVNLVPGYEMSRWNALLPSGQRVGDVLWSCIRGAYRIEEWAPRLNDAANRELRNAGTAGSVLLDSSRSR